jgi:hypothetical protein
MSSKVMLMLDMTPGPDLKRLLRVLPCAAALLAAGCSPRAFDGLPAPKTSDVETSGVEAGAVDDGEAQDAQDEPDDADAMAEEDAGTDPIDGGPPDAADPNACPDRPGPGHEFKVKTTRELGPLQIPEAPAFRTLSGSTRLGEHILWSFHNASFATDPPVTHPSAALSSLEAPLELSDLADANGLPLPFVQRESAEDSTAFSLDTGSVVATSEHAALVFFTRIYVLVRAGVGVAHVDARGASARVPGLMFQGDDPHFFLGGFVHEGYLYLYGNEVRENDANSPLSPVVRAPVLDAARRSSYRAWSADQQAWVPELQKRTAVLSRAPNALSVSYNRFLGAFVAVFSTQSGDAIELQLAPTPEGPFSTFEHIETEPSPFSDLPTYYGMQHAALSSACDRRIVLSYTLPSEQLPTVLGPITSNGETRLLEVELE